ncbi:MAG: ABC transporter permease [Candidatus Solibacter sp.]
MGHLWQDVRHALRVLGRTPAFTAVAVCSLALGIGANTAIFSLVYATLLKPLPFRDPARLVAVWDTYQPLFPKLGVSPAEYDALRRQTDLLEQAAWYRYVPVDLNWSVPGAPAIELHGGVIDPGLLPLLGVAPAAGRAFENDGESHRVLLSDRLWRSSFAAAPDVVGRGIRLGGEEYTVSGVMPRGFDFPTDTDFWLPPGPLMGDERTNPVRHAFGFVARLRPGVSQEQARRRLAEVMQRLAGEHPQTSRGFGVQIAPLQEDLTAGMRPSLLLLLGAGSLVLLVACGNVANLLLSRGAGRVREIAIRTALGAGVGRLLRQLLTESVVLALLGGALGLTLAAWTVEALSPAPAGLDAPVLCYAFGISLATGVLFGVAPAWQARRVDPIAAIKSGAGRGGSARRASGALVTIEVAFTLVVVIGAGMLAKSFFRLMRVDPGFDPRGVLSLRMAAPAASDAAARFARIHDQLRGLPGVQAVASASALPLVAPRASAMRFNVPGSPLIRPDTFPVAQQRAVSPEYLVALGLPLRAGRWFTAQDLAQPVAVVNQTLAQRFWPGEDATGKRFIPGPPGSPPNFVTIIGVVGDVKQFGLDSETTMDIYFPSVASRYLLVRTAGDPAQLASAIQRELVSSEPGVALADVRTMQEVVAQSGEARRRTAGILAAFALLAFVLAFVGIYGVMSWTVAERTREIAIRVALGAQGAQVMRMVLGNSARLTALGLGIGLGAAFALRPLLAGLIFGMGTTDAAVYGGAALLLLLTALLAAYLPARRASRVAPVEALRE